MGGIVSGIFGGGDDAADASRDAAAVQASATKQAAQLQKETTEKQIAFQKESLETARKDLEPFRTVGSTDLQGLADLVTNPQKQAEFVQNNPFFNAMATKASDTIMGNAAAKGKLGSGGTAEALQNSLLLLGTDLLNQNIGQRQNLATLGANAAAGQATATQGTASAVGALGQNSANNISNLITQGANAQASGIVGAANARTNASNSLVSTGLGIAGLFI